MKAEISVGCCDSQRTYPTVKYKMIHESDDTKSRYNTRAKTVVECRSSTSPMSRTTRRDMMLSTMALEDVLDGGHCSFETTLVAQLFLNRAA